MDDVCHIWGSCWTIVIRKTKRKKKRKEKHFIPSACVRNLYQLITYFSRRRETSFLVVVANRSARRFKAPTFVVRFVFFFARIRKLRARDTSRSATDSIIGMSRERKKKKNYQNRLEGTLKEEKRN